MAHLSPNGKKYFLQPWTLTTPSNPTIQYHRALPSDFNAWLPLITNPQNNIHMSDMRDLTWNTTEIEKWKTRTLESYNASLLTFHHLQILISDTDTNTASTNNNNKRTIIGYGDLFLLQNGSFNIGLAIDSSHQRKGIGKLTMRVFIQLALEIGKSDVVEMGTMKSNEGFRGLMRSLGVGEREKLVVAEGRGVLAELCFELSREEWHGVELDFRWGEGMCERVESV